MTGQGKKSLTEQKKRLLEEQQRTLAEIESQRGYLATGFGRLSDGSADSVDAAGEIFERQKTLAIIRTLEDKLASIGRALRAAEKGIYGICEVCGEAIAPGRLEVIPHTTICVTCKANQERRLPRRGPTTVTREEA